MKKVIFHIDEMDKWNLLLTNVKNLIDATTDTKIKIEVIANSEAVKGYKHDFKLVKTIDELNEEGVKFIACNNALKGNGLIKEDILTFVQIVPTGVLEIIEKQEKGYAYVKP
ncbi:MAG TPA: DsrE family protein [Tissierellales bacterium]|nr:DsrE family protein [Tissierellales bacterium]